MVQSLRSRCEHEHRTVEAQCDSPSKFNRSRGRVTRRAALPVQRTSSPLNASLRDVTAPDRHSNRLGSRLEATQIAAPDGLVPSEPTIRG
jgi:hypothetical protein